MSKMMKRTRTICATGAGRGNMLISHQMSPKTTRYMIRLMIKFIFAPTVLKKSIIYTIINRPSRKDNLEGENNLMGTSPEHHSQNGNYSVMY
jgi:hypothetical protein